MGCLTIAGLQRAAVGVACRDQPAYRRVEEVRHGKQSVFPAHGQLQQHRRVAITDCFKPMTASKPAGRAAGGWGDGRQQAGLWQTAGSHPRPVVGNMECSTRSCIPKKPSDGTTGLAEQGLFGAMRMALCPSGGFG